MMIEEYWVIIDEEKWVIEIWWWIVCYLFVVLWVDVAEKSRKQQNAFMYVVLSKWNDGLLVKKSDMIF